MWWHVFILITIAILALAVSVYILLPMIIGAPYVKSNKKSREIMFELARIQPGELVIDLGSGDGALLIEAAKLGALAIGYEINPFLVWYSRVKAKKSGMSGKIEIRQQSFWSADLSQAAVVLLFGITHIMPALERKLQRELPGGARIVSNTFRFPRWQSVEEKENVRLYLKT